MKKKLLIALSVALLLVLSLGSAVFATDPTNVTVTWDGAGVVDGSVDTGDALTYFHSEGSNHIGTFQATDSNDNPYNYNVDTCSFSLDTVIGGIGWADLEVNRTDSKSSMYGVAGQQSYTYVGVSNGLATLQNRSWTNYASMKDSNYGWNANDHITVIGATAYTLQRFMDSGNVNFAEFWASGTGDADLDCMSSEAGAGQVRLGWGCGCYTNADFTASGAGTAKLTGVGNNSATTAMTPGMVGATSFQIIANWVGSFSIADYSTTAN